ncbi:uncharacterized protein VP01_4165g2 [Puccinia sorghi]|uniref:Retrotransposon gag domain-containing protein n=1 Tax=Puccinia sorghi TaxID=27349 RepID=A0A0L6USW7_9BASI|nr:uncharacterized protein VP01_4165g2 [Puccinia sorghi]
MMRMLAKGRAQQLTTEENLCQTQARLDAAPKLQGPGQATPFNRTRGAVAKSFLGQILLHAITYPECFPTDSRKVAFSVLFMTDYAENWSKPYLMKVFNAEEVALNKFLDDFKSSFFDHNCQHCAEVALQSLLQTGTVKTSNLPWL